MHSFLDLSFNALTGLPDSASRLKQLASINLAFNPLHAIPPALMRLDNLHELNMDHTGMALHAGAGPGPGGARDGGAARVFCSPL